MLGSSAISGAPGALPEAEMASRPNMLGSSAISGAPGAVWRDLPVQESHSSGPLFQVGVLRTMGP